MAYPQQASSPPQARSTPASTSLWKRLAEHGFGLWCEPPYEAVPPSLDASTLLGAFGYDVSNNEAAIGAFNRHFAGVESRRMTEAQRSRLYCLMKRKSKSAATKRPGWAAR